MRPKKRFAQHFLRNRGAVDRIVAAVEPEPGEIVIEIGPGEGALTEKLIALGNEFVAYEIDPDLSAHLRQRFGDAIRTADAVEAPLPDRPYRAVGNLPYNVGTPILRRIVADPRCRRAVFMLQKEVANRLVAKPGDDDYGFLTLYVRLYASARTLLTLEPKSFYPAPKVRSAVVILDPAPRNYATDPSELTALISTSFRMRRKKLVNNLLNWNGADREEVLRAMREADIGEAVRAEELSLEQFDALAGALRRSRR